MIFTEWDGQDLSGSWLITLKIDGIQAHYENGELVTKNNKKIYNLPKKLKSGDIFEIFCGSWNTTMSIAMSSKAKRRKIKSIEIFKLYPQIDPRLSICKVLNPSAVAIQKALELANKKGYEGLVLRSEDQFIKVKPHRTIDIKVTGYVESNKRKGLIRKLITDKGDVGTGFSLAQRKEFLNDFIIGKTIEVLITEFTKNGKFRNPRFIRLREDKDA